MQSGGLTAVGGPLDPVLVVHAFLRRPGAGTALFEETRVLPEMRAHLALGVLTAGGLAGILDAGLSVSERRGQDHRRNRDTESGHRDRAEDRTFHVSPSFSGSGPVYRLSLFKRPRVTRQRPFRRPSRSSR